MTPSWWWKTSSATSRTASRRSSRAACDGRGHRTDHGDHLGAGGVFIPTAFLSGLQGEFYRQFALTIAISTILSALNSLTPRPWRACCCASAAGRRCGGGRFSDCSRSSADRCEMPPEAYGNAVRKVVRVSGLALVVMGALRPDLVGFRRCHRASCRCRTGTIWSIA